MTLPECSTHHLQHMRAACIVVAQQYRVNGYDDKTTDCALCMAALAVSEVAWGKCNHCPWVIFFGTGCLSEGARYGSDFSDIRVDTLENDWIPQFDAELASRGW